MTSSKRPFPALGIKSGGPGKHLIFKQLGIPTRFVWRLRPNISIALNTMANLLKEKGRNLSKTSIVEKCVTEGLIELRESLSDVDKKTFDARVALLTTEMHDLIKEANLGGEREGPSVNDSKS